MKETVIKLFRKLRLALISLCSKSILFSKVYYVLFSDRFDDEIYSVLNARKKYLKNNLACKSSVGYLRRNIHRIEKGLIMKPRRDCFASTYIADTVSCLLLVKDNLDTSTILWSIDVLDDYFNEIDINGIENGLEVKELFYAHFSSTRYNDNRLVPYSRPKKELLSYEKLLELATYRRSVRWYNNKVVEKSIIGQAIEIAKLSPTACNRVPYKYYIPNDRDVTLKVLECAGGTMGFADNITHVAALVGDLVNYEYEVDRHLIYIDASLSAMSFCYALEVLGVSSVCINWQDSVKRNNMIRDLLPISDSERVVMLIGFGYADEAGLIPFSGKKDNCKILEFI